MDVALTTARASEGRSVEVCCVCGGGGLYMSVSVSVSVCVCARAWAVVIEYRAVLMEGTSAT